MLNQHAEDVFQSFINLFKFLSTLEQQSKCFCLFDLANRKEVYVSNLRVVQRWHCMAQLEMVNSFVLLCVLWPLCQSIHTIFAQKRSEPIEQRVSHVDILLFAFASVLVQRESRHREAIQTVDKRFGRVVGMASILFGSTLHQFQWSRSNHIESELENVVHAITTTKQSFVLYGLFFVLFVLFITTIPVCESTSPTPINHNIQSISFTNESLEWIDIHSACKSFLFVCFASIKTKSPRISKENKSNECSHNSHTAIQLVHISISPLGIEPHPLAFDSAKRRFVERPANDERDQ